MDQLKESQNDYGRTIESVANQMRVFNEQTQRLTRALGNMFLPILQKILPYLNAFLMVLTEIVNWLATLFGYDEDLFSGFASGVGDITNDFIDLGNSLDNANKSAKKLKQGLRGFDKLNVITTPTSGAGNVGVGSGINPKIMEAFNKSMKEYEDRLEKVQMKATKIRDNIMEWLGFTKEVDKETGKVSFKFDHITGGTVLGALAVGGTIYNGVKKILDFMQKIGLIKFNLPSIGSIFGGIGKITGITSLISTVTEGIKLWIGGAGTFGEVFTGIILPAIKIVGGKFLGIFGVITGIIKTVKSISDIVQNGFNFDNIMDGLIGIGKVISGVLMFINPIAGLIGFAITGVLELVKVIVDNWEYIKELFSTLIEKVSNIFTTILEFLNKYLITPLMTFYHDWIEPLITTTVEGVIYIGTKVWEIVSGIIKAIVSIVKKVIEIGAKIVEIVVALAKAFDTYVGKPIREFIGSIFKWVYDNAIKPLVKLFGNVGKWVYENIIKPVYDKVVWLKNKAVGIFKAIGKTVVDFISGSFKGVINGVLSVIEKNINKFIKMLNGAIGIINEIPGVEIKKVEELSIPRLQKGMDFVPSDYYGPVYLDYGERVLTKEENQRYSSGNDYNNNIVSSSSSGNKQPQVFNIYLDKDTKIASYVLDQLDDMASANGKPITIGG